MPFPICPAPSTPILSIILGSSSCTVATNGVSHAFEDGRERLTPAEAEDGQAVAALPSLQLPDDRRRQSPAAGADGVAEGAGAAVNIDLVDVEAEGLDRDHRHHGEGLVDLEEVDIADGQPRLRAGLLDGADRCIREVVGMEALGGRRDEPGLGGQAELLEPRFVSEKRHGGPVADGGGVAGRDRAVFLERRTQLRELREIDLERPLVGVDRHIAFLPCRDERDDLIPEDALRHRCLGQAVGAKGEFVLLFAREAVSREEQDEFALRSYRLAQAAVTEGVFRDEIVPFVKTGKKGEVTVDTDEGPFKIDFAKLTQLRPAFKKDGTITAGNASTISDGAAVALLTDEAGLKKFGLTPKARLVAAAPSLMV